MAGQMALLGSVFQYFDLTFSTLLFLLIRLLHAHLSCTFALALYTGFTLTSWVVLELLAVLGRFKPSDQIPFSRRFIYAWESAVWGLATFSNLAENSIAVSQLWQLLSMLNFERLSHFFCLWLV